MDYETVSAKIPKKIKKKIKEYNINVSNVIRKAIEEEIRKIEMKKIKEEMKSIKPIVNKIPIESVIQSIREDRER